MTGSFLNLAKWDAGIQGGGDERMAQRVWSDSLVDLGVSGDASHDP